MLHDPVCGQRIRRDRAHVHIEHARVVYYLCCPRCQAEFEAAPEQYAQPEWGETVTCSHRVAGAHYCAPAPSEPDVTLSRHPAQALSTL